MLGTLRQVGIAAGDLPAGRGNRVGTTAHFAHHRHQAVLHAAQHAEHARGFVARRRIGLHATAGRCLGTQVAAGDPVEACDGNVERLHDRTAQAPCHHGAERQAQHQCNDRHREQVAIPVLRRFVDLLRAGQLQLVESGIGRGEGDVEPGDFLEHVLHHRIAIGRVQCGNQGGHALLEQRIAPGGDIIDHPFFFRRARQRKVGLPCFLGIARKALGGRGAGLGVGRVRGEGGLVEQHPHQQLVRARFGKMHRCRQLLRIDLARGLVAARHAEPADGADNQQQQVGNDRQEPQSGSDASVLEH
ncbi:hypothetical protein D9M68_566650 [compost metagenome]